MGSHTHTGYLLSPRTIRSARTVQVKHYIQFAPPGVATTARGFFFSPKKNSNMSHQSVRHPDLSRLSDRQLELDITYTLQNHFEIYQRIRTRLTILANTKISVQNVVPTWKLHEDLQTAAERIEAIIEELEYRQIP